jgi:hypothetical protein
MESVELQGFSQRSFAMSAASAKTHAQSPIAIEPLPPAAEKRTYGLYLSVEAVDALDRYAESLGRNRSEVVELILRRAVPELVSLSAAA